MLLRRIVLLYIVLLLCRIVFYCYNYALIGPLGWQEVLTLAGGASEVRHRIGALRQSCCSSCSRSCRSICGNGAGIGVLLFWLLRRWSIRLLIVAVNLGRLRLFPLYAEAFHRRRNLLRRQLQFGAARAGNSPPKTGTCSSSAQSSSGCSFGVTDARSHPDRPCARAGFITRSIQDCW